MPVTGSLRRIWSGRMTEQVVQLPLAVRCQPSEARRDFDSLARMLGPADRAAADLTKSEKKLLGPLAMDEQLTDLGRVALAALLATGAECQDRSRSASHLVSLPSPARSGKAFPRWLA